VEYGTNRKVVLARRPDGMPGFDDFRLEEEALRAPNEGEVLIANDTLSIDAFIRTTLDETSFHTSAPIGGTVSAIGVGRVVESGSAGLEPGDGVVGPLSAQTHALLSADYVQKVDEKRAPLRAYLGILGLTTGITAWVGVRLVGRVRRGETFVVSAGAGAVGSVAGQIAKLEGARVIGIAGGSDKLRTMTDELGFDAGIDYKGEDVDARLRELAPDGVDVFFDNVGGDLLDVVLDQIRLRARVVICGAISQYQHMGDVRGPRLYLRLAERQARMEGFAVNHFEDRYEEASIELAKWLDAGQIQLGEHVEQGIDRFPAALRMLFEGGHTGKLLVSV
jgi:NADPH-dependent curcumin reductase CurA